MLEWLIGDQLAPHVRPRPRDHDPSPLFVGPLGKREERLAERLRQKGETEIADELQNLAFGMRRLINHELSKARLQSAPGKTTEGIAICNVIESVIRTLSRSPKAAGVSWRNEVSTEAIAYIAIEDATELFGVLLENAVKWAKTEVRTAARGETALHIIIEDDGPGVSADKIAKLGQRGVRLDETTEGSGLGLSIAADIVEAYGGQMSFGARTPHGFQVTVLLPGLAKNPKMSRGSKRG